MSDSSTTFPSSAPEPLVPAHVKFPGYEFMLLDIKLITESDLAFLSGDGFKAAVTLMAKSWQESPATSLPDDDRLLANLAGFGKGRQAQAEWERVKDEALSDFTLCSDGRFYSRSLQDKALSAWDSKGAQTRRTEAARKAKAEKAREEAARRKRDEAPVTQQADPIESTNGAATASVTENVTTSVTEHVTSPVTQSRREEKRREEKRGDDNGNATAPAYAFEDGVIRLTDADFAKWKQIYPSINLAMELASLSEWATSLKAEGRDWFHAVKAALAKKERTASEANRRMRIRAEAEAKAGVQSAERSRRPAI